MKTLLDVLQKLDEMDVDPVEVKISRAAYQYLVERGEEIIAKEEEDGEEE